MTYNEKRKTKDKKEQRMKICAITYNVIKDTITYTIIIE